MKRFTRFLAVAGVAAVGVLSLPGSAGAVGTISVTPNTGLTNGQVVTVSGTLPPGSDYVISQCNDAPSGVSFDPIADCDGNSVVLSFDPVGTGGTFTESFTIWTGTRNGFTCDETNPCQLRVNTGVLSGQGDQAFAPISFAPASTTTTTQATTTTTVADTTTTTVADTTTTTVADTTTTTAPDPVVPEAPYAVLLPLGGAAVLGAAYLLVRRGRVPA